MSSVPAKNGTSLPAGAASPSGGRRRSRRTGHRARIARATPKLALVAPATALFLAFYAVPVIAGIVLSVFRWNGLSSPEWVGFANYEYLLNDPVFATNMRVTVLVVVVSLLATLPPALLLAVCLSGNGRWLPLFRWIVFLPVVFPIAAAALLWSEIFNPVNGLANELLAAVGLAPVAWLGDDEYALWALIVVAVWTTLGLHVVIQLSALSAIPTDLKEAARLETSSGWRIFRHVILPLMRESLTVSAALIVTGSFAVFTSLAFIMTRGGPMHSTEVLGVRAYLEGFASLEFGRASAITVVTMTMTILFVGAILAIGGRRRVEY